MENFICKKCKSECNVDGEYPKFFCWCDTCETYAKGFDVLKYSADYISGLTDYIYDKMKDEKTR